MIDGLFIFCYYLSTVKLNAGISHVCINNENNEMTCWGRNDQHQTDIPENMRKNVQDITAGY